MTKSILLCVACCILLTVCKAQTSITKPNAGITLIIKNAPRQMFFLMSSNPYPKFVVIDSAMLGTKGGIDTMHFDLTVEGRESILRLVFSKHESRRFVPILAPGEHLEITVDLDHPDDVSFTGSARTREFYDFWKQRMNMDVATKYKIALNAGSPDSIILKQRIDSINNLTGLFIRKTIFNTECGFVAMFSLMDSQNGVLTYTKKELNQLRGKFKDDSATLKQIDLNENLQDHPRNTKPKPANGTYLTAFTLPDMNGKKVSLDQFKGKYVLVDFWASWCVPCRMQSPYLKKVSDMYGKNNFVILSVSIDENHDDWKKAIIQDGTKAFVNLIDDRGRKSPVKNQYNINSIPSNFLLDPAGKVIDKDLKGEKLVARVAEIIQNTQIKN